jgi:glycosyltransferase involved in cell wall biosynthesis
MSDSLRLGFHYHIPVYQDRDGRLLTPGHQGRFLDSLADRCQTLVCFMHSPRSDEIPQMDYVLRAPNIRGVNIGLHFSFPRRILRARSIVRPVRDHCTRLDALLIRGPTPLLPAMTRAVGDLPIALLLVGDYIAGIGDLPKPRWIKELLRVWTCWYQRRQLAVARRALTFVNSRKLYEQFRPHVVALRETRTTTLSAADFFERDDTCLERPYRLLYTGRMDRAKGLFEMVEAVARLVEQGEDVVLALVGWASGSDTILEELNQFAEANGVADRVIYHGYKPVGPELFEYYKSADVYLIASLSSEGFPRTIWEAMAHSLPVVATRVGSIPTFLQDQATAVLVEPRDSVALAKAISTIIHDEALRRSLIRQGIEIARPNTLDERAEEMLSQIRHWLSEEYKRHVEVL